MLPVSSNLWARALPSALAAIAFLSPTALTAAPTADASARAAAAYAATQGRRYVAENKLNEAIGWYEDALNGYWRAGDIGKQAVILTCLADINERAKRYEIALAYDQRSLGLDTQAKDLRSEAVDYYNIGRIQQKLHKNSDALASYLQSAQTFHDLGDYSAEIVHLDQAAGFSESTGDLKKALTTRQAALAVAKTNGKQTEQYEQYSKIASIYETLKLDDKALEFRHQALDLARAADNLPAIATQLAAIGTLFEAKGDHVHALECHQQALGLSLLAENHTPEADELAQIADAYERLGERDKALVYHQKAMDAYLRGGNKSGALVQANTICRDQIAAQRPEKALDAAKTALALAQSAEKTVSLSDQYLQLASTYEFVGRLSDASDAYNQALPLIQQQGNRDQQRAVLGKVASIALKAGHFEKCLALYYQVVSLDRDAHDRKSEAADYAAIGAAYAADGKNVRAVEAYSLALAIHHQIGQPSDVRMDLHQIAFISARGQANERAIECYHQALAIDLAAKNTLNAIDDYRGIADAYAQLGKLPDALEAQMHVVSLAYRLPDRHATGRYLIDLALLQRDLNLSSDALRTFQDAVNRLDGLPQQRLRRFALSESAKLLSALGHNADALDSAQKALAIGRQMHQPGTIMECLADEAIYLTRAGQLDRARAMTDELFTSAKANNNRLMLASACEDQAMISAAARDLVSACEWNARALHLRKKIGDWVGCARTSRRQIALFATWDRPRMAIAYGKYLLNQIQGSLWSGPTGSIQESSHIENEISQSYRTVASMLVDQHRLNEAMQIISILKRQELAGFAAQHRWASGSSVPLATLTTRERSEAEMLAGAETHYCSLVDTQGAARLAGDVGDTFTAARRHYEALLVVAGQDLPDPSVSGESPIGGDLPSVTAPPAGFPAAPSPGVAIVRLLVSTDGIRFIVLSEKGMQAESTAISVNELREMAARWHDQLTDPDVDPRPLGEQLYKLLVTPILPDLNEANPRVILWSLDDVLRYLPIGALYDGNSYLAQRYQNVLLAENPNLLTDTQGQTARRHWYVFGAGVTKSHEAIPARIWTGNELRAIIVSSKGAGSLPGTICLDDQFTVSRLRSELATGYPVIHIASALGIGSDERASSLVVDGGELSYLNALGSDPTLFKDVDLLTFSNCRFDLAFNGGDGHEVEGLGAYSRALGASSVLVSMWVAPETSTRKFMAKFYQAKTWNAQATKASAVQTAQTALLTGSDNAAPSLASAQMPDTTPNPQGDHLYVPPPGAPFSHPFYWAGFQLIGDWR